MVTHEFNPNQHHICSTPCPIIMSQDRHACGVHLSQAFNKIVVRSEKEKLGDIPADFANNKASHANLLYNRWASRRLNTSSLKD